MEFVRETYIRPIALQQVEFVRETYVRLIALSQAEFVRQAAIVLCERIVETETPVSMKACRGCFSLSAPVKRCNSSIVGF